MSKERVQATVWRCVCEVQGCQRNGEPWLSLADRPPKVCPTCRSREWNGPKVKRKPARGPKIELPKPMKVKAQGEKEFF
jgi:hypothetical protein